MNWLKSDRVGKTVVIAAFICILLIGLFVFDDYGTSMDEPVQLRHSQISYRTLARIFF